MSDRRVRALLCIIAAAMVASLALFLLDPPREDPQPPPHESSRAAERLALHPTDWAAVSVISEHALEGDSPRRVEMWRESSALALKLAPHTGVARNGFLRAGLFHWYELGDGDRRAVLAELAPLMREPAMFYRVAQPLFELTGDLKYLRRNQPHTIETVRGLRDLAAMHGRFDDYRELRDELNALRREQLPKRFESLPPSEIITALPAHPTADDQVLITAALRVLHEQPLEVDCGRPDVLDAVIDYALRHRLAPLDGLAQTVHEPKWASAYVRAALARALGDPASAQQIDPDGQARPTHGETLIINGVTWDGACGAMFCRDAHAELDGPRPITLDNARSDEVPPYVEIYVDDERVWEGAIPGKLAVPPIPAGHHRVEIRLVNPLTRNREGRAVRIS